jgi:hypothetical protein
MGAGVSLHGAAAIARVRSANGNCSRIGFFVLALEALPPPKARAAAKRLCVEPPAPWERVGIVSCHALNASLAPRAVNKHAKYSWTV